MYLKSYPKLVRSELRLDPAGVQTSSQRGSLYVGQQVAVLRACVTPGNGNHGNISSGRLPFSVISTNTLCRGNATNNSNVSNSAGSHRLNHHGKTKTSSPLCPSPPPGCENKEAVSLYQTAAEDGDAPLDIWAVIKPGNVQEKIAIFASASGRAGATGGGNCGVTRSSDGEDGTPQAVGSNSTAVAGLSRAVKVKGGWEENSAAKRRRKSGSNHHQNHQNQDQRARLLDQQHAHKPAQYSPDLWALGQADRRSGGEVEVAGEGGEEEEGEGGGKVVSVVEMVAFLEQRTNEQLDSKPLLSLQRSSTTITLSRAPPAPDHSREGSEVRSTREEEPDSVRVSDMVAKLESECLRRRTLGGGDLSRNNSLRRTVGRMLLAGGEPCSASSQPPSSPSLPEVHIPARLKETHPDSSSEDPASPTDKPRKESVSLASAPASPPCPASTTPSLDEAHCEAPVEVKEVRLEAGGPRQGLEKTEGSSEGGSGEPPQPEKTELTQPETQCHASSRLHPQLQDASGSQTQSQTPTDSPQQPEEEPLPGMLFFSQPPASEPHTSLPSSSSTQTPPDSESLLLPPSTDSELCLTSDLKMIESLLLLHPPGCPSSLPKNRNKRERRNRVEEVGGALRPTVSHEFLEMRFKLQLLLEPQPYLAFLPHHIVVKVFSLLPTQSLAALKCTCHYFKFIIENYGVRPADSRWVSDPRYRDDPCKQCKKRYGRGDVSLCRWHHKPYCQAMPYGPGYWMCCHGAHKDTPGCNVGLHDNRWVPAFHSINMPIYRRNRDSEEEV